jgi:pimeloyl-ACP methyl ester carboxylesterase
MEDICREVSEEIEQTGIRKVSLVGHSMGGLLARTLAARRIPGLEVRKVVMIGTPLLGSRLAGHLSRLPVQALPYGNLWPALSPEACAANGESVEGVEMGMIAGSVPGGRWIFGEDTDGIVPVSATRGSGLTGHATVAASHASLLLSQKVAGMTATFLAGGKLGF